MKQQPLVYLNSQHIREIAHELVVSFFYDKNEPLPAFADHDPRLLDSALNLPRQTYDGRELYPSLIQKASVLFYALIKNHPFQNGNKRMAVTSLLVFLYLNGRWLEAKPRELYRLARRTAISDRRRKDRELKRLYRFLRRRLVDRAHVPIKKRELLYRVFRRTTRIVVRIFPRLLFRRSQKGRGQRLKKQKP